MPATKSPAKRKKTTKAPRKASPASIAARKAYVARRPMVGYYLDPEMVAYVEALRRVSPDAKIPSASAVVRAILNEYMELHPIGERSTPARRKGPEKK